MQYVLYRDKSIDQCNVQGQKKKKKKKICMIQSVTYLWQCVVIPCPLPPFDKRKLNEQWCEKHRCFIINYSRKIRKKIMVAILM